MPAERSIRVWDTPAARCGEAPYWSAAEQCLWWVDMYAGCFYRTSWAGVTVSSAIIAPRLSFVIPTAAGLLAGTERAILLGSSDAGWQTAVNLQAMPADVVINDGKLDPHGHLWFSTRVRGGRSREGGLYRWDGSTVATAREGLVLGNGIAWSPDGARLYNVDTVAQTVEVYQLDVETGWPTAGPEIFCRVPDGSGLPDGLTVDRAGDVWIALFDGWAVHRYSAAGELMERQELPVRCPTSCVFGGPDLGTLFITTSSLGDSTRQDPYAGRLLSMPAGVHG